MKKEMIITTCDNCGAEVMNPHRPQKGIEFPRGWIHIVISDFSHVILAHDLCPKCSAPVMDAAQKVPNKNV